MAKAEENAIRKVTDSLTKDLPNIVKDNKGAAIGAVVGYLLSDKLKENDGIVTALLGGLVGKAVDDKQKESRL